MPSVAASAAISVVLRAKLKARIGDVEIEMLGHLVPVDHRADRERDLGGAAQRIALAGDGRLDAGEIALGGGEQVFALAGALGGEIGIAADHQTLAGEIGCGDAGHVALVEQRELQRAALQQRLDRRRAQRGDPVQAGRFDVLGDARLGDHAAIADQHHMLEAEALLELLDLRRQRHRIGGVAVEHLDGDRAAVGRRRAGRRRSAACPSCRRGCSRAWRAGSSVLPCSSTRRRRAPACRW